MKLAIHPEENFTSGAQSAEPKPGLVGWILGWVQKLWQIRILRFFAVGALNTLFSYVIYAILILLGLHYTLATLFSTILGIIFNFFTTGRLVFRSMNNRLFYKFVMVYGCTYLVNILLLHWLVDLLAVNKLVAGAITTLPVAMLSYTLNSRFTFSKQTEISESHPEKP